MIAAKRPSNPLGASTSKKQNTGAIPKHGGASNMPEKMDTENENAENAVSGGDLGGKDGEPISPSDVYHDSDGRLCINLADTFNMIMQQEETYSDNSYFGTCITPFREKIDKFLAPHKKNVIKMEVGELKCVVKNWQPLVNNQDPEGLVVHSQPMSASVMQIFNVNKISGDLAEGVGLVELFGRNNDDQGNMASNDNVVLIPFLNTEVRLRTGTYFAEDSKAELQIPASRLGLRQCDQRYIPWEKVLVSTVATETGEAKDLVFSAFQKLPTLEEMQFIRGACGMQQIVIKPYLNLIRSGVERYPFNVVDAAGLNLNTFRKASFIPIQNKVRGSKGLIYHAMNEPYSYISHPGYTVFQVPDALNMRAAMSMPEVINAANEKVATPLTVDRVLYPYYTVPAGNHYINGAGMYKMYNGKIPKTMFDSRHGETMDVRRPGNLTMFSLKALRNGIDGKPLPVSVQFDVSYTQTVKLTLAAQPGQTVVNRTDNHDIDLGIFSGKTQNMVTPNNDSMSYACEPLVLL